jgi:beta-1,4-N-acetylglucosaminyltransferase
MANLERHCLVTVGATVGFKQLTEQVLEAAFWQFLSSEGFTSLRIQCGPDISWAKARLASLQEDVPDGLKIDAFDSTKNLMRDEMMLCKASSGTCSTGLVISHAGKSILLPCMMGRELGESILVLTFITRNRHNS